jgi:transposase-like protein
MGKRRTFTAEFKADQVLAVLMNMKSQAEVCREHQIKPQLLNRWKTQLLENAAVVYGGNEQGAADAERIRELEQTLGRKTLELEMAKKVSRRLS